MLNPRGDVAVALTGLTVALAKLIVATSSSADAAEKSCEYACKILPVLVKGESATFERFVRPHLHPEGSTRQ